MSRKKEILILFSAANKGMNMALRDLFIPKWKHSDPLRRKAAVEKLTDQSLLAAIAKSDDDIDVRVAAVENPSFSDQAILAEIINNHLEYEQVRYAAAGKLNDKDLAQRAFADIVIFGNFKYYREAAWEKIGNLDMIARIAKGALNSDMRKATVERINDQATLAEIAKTDRNEDIRWAAVERLIDQTSLAEITKTEKNERILYKAVRKITDQTALADVVRNVDVAHIRMAAVNKITDQAVLAEIARADKDENIRNTAAILLNRPKTKQAFKRTLIELPLVDRNQAYAFLSERAMHEKHGKDVSGRIRIGIADDVIHNAIAITSAGGFEDLVKSFRIVNNPFPHIEAPHEWRHAEDAFGTDHLFIVRVDEAQYLWFDQQNYG